MLQFYNKPFRAELYRLYQEGLTVAQLSDYFGMSQEEINNALDDLIPIWEVSGKPYWEYSEEQQEDTE